MKITPTHLACLLATLLPLAGLLRAAKEEAKPAELTLEDIIFDAQYLKKMLGTKTLVTAVVETNRNREKSGTALADAINAVKEARLDEKTQIFSLPDGADQPKLKKAAPHTYPPGLNLSRDAKKADFLILIGADGAVKCMYCYNNNDRLFALAAAQAVVKWRYTPAKINGTAVPVVASLPMEFKRGDANVDRNKPRGGMEGGAPTRVLPPPPPPRGTVMGGQ